MKKFFVMILLVSTFFIGLSALVEQAGAKFKSDAKALEIIRQARVAIGGDANIVAVRSLTIAGNTTHFFDTDGLAQTGQGTLEINLQLPGQFSKMVRIGNPENATAGTEVQKQVDVIVMRTEGETVSAVPSTEGKPGVFIVKDGDGKILTEEIRGGAGGKNKIIIKKDDGTVQEITPDEKSTVVFERKSGDGGDTQVWKTEDGKKIVVSKDLKTENIFGNRHNEMFRMTLSLLLSAPEGLDVSYSFAGEGSVDGSSCNIVEARTNGSTFKLFLDKSTFLPRMISYDGRDVPHIIRVKKEGSGEVITENIVGPGLDPADGKTLEHQLKFSDFRSVGGLFLPHTWTETVGGKQTQNVDITNYEVNPANIADKFKGQKVFVRKAKDQ